MAKELIEELFFLRITFLTLNKGGKKDIPPNPAVLIQRKTSGQDVLENSCFKAQNT